ncbi:hypothetical protein IFR05_011806 [Cadophora sp. M221]|nr:hypothetical protein IFR05_011806 [Cadophora sp. M221]
MISTFKASRPSSDSDDFSSSDEEHVLPPGTPYLTKVNGKLVWARKKNPKPIKPVHGLLGEAFGSRAVIVRRRSKSLERPVTRVVIGNTPLPRQRQISYSAPLPQQPFPASMPPMAQTYNHPQYPPQYLPPYPPPYLSQYPPGPPQFQLQPMLQPGTQAQQAQQTQQPPYLYIPQQQHILAPLLVQRSPTEKEKEQLRAFDAHFKQTVKLQTTRVTSASSEDSQDKQKDKRQEKVGGSITENIGDETTTKVKIATTRHVCGDCGRLRSRKYHHDHPLKPGEIPELAFCRKCQKDASSTSESSEDEVEKFKKKSKSKKKAKNSKAPSKKPVESSDGDEESSDHTELPKKSKPDRPKPQSKKPPAKAKQAAAEEYIIIEEEFSDHERQPKGQSRRRVSPEYEAQRHPLSPLASQHSVTRPGLRSYLRPSKQDQPRNEPHPIGIHETIKDTSRRQSPHIQYRYVEVIPGHESFERKEPSNTRESPIHFAEKAVFEKPLSPKYYQQSDKGHERASSNKAYSVDKPESMHRSYHARVEDFEQDTWSRGPSSSIHETFEVRDAPSRGPLPSRHDSFEVHEAPSRRPPSRHHSFEEPGTMSHMHSSEARRRRKRERAPPGTPDTRPWEEPHVLHHESDDEVIAVTETYEYRKKKQNQDEEERRKQEYIDRATWNSRDHNQFSAEEASRYYREDWTRGQPEFVPPSLDSLVGKPYQPYQPYQPLKVKGYRRDRQPESEVTESESSYGYSESIRHDPPRTPPRAPTPLSPLLYNSEVRDWSRIKDTTDWGDAPLYPTGSVSDFANRRYDVPQMPSVEIPHRQRSNSNAGSASMQEATNGVKETALILTPRHSNERNRDAYNDYSESSITERQHGDGFDTFSGSNMTELERQAESEARHVTFRETTSMRSVRENGGASGAHSQHSRSEHGGGGWESGGARPWGDW